MKRVLLIAAVAAGISLWLDTRAQALTELCPATASQLNVLDGASGAKAGTTFSYELVALSAETVSGTLSIQTDDGWYQVPFGPVALTGHKESYTMGQASFVRENMFSDPLYLRFPKTVKPSRVFISSITTDDTAFAWPTKTELECEAGGDAFLFASPAAGKSADGDVGPVHAALLAPPGASTPVGLATKTTAFDALGCAMPFKSASATGAVAPDFPRAGMGSPLPVKVLVAVAIDANGKVTDDWLVAPAPFVAFNNSAIRAAEQTTYAPAISRCRPVPGVYLFHAEFSQD